MGSEHHSGSLENFNVIRCFCGCSVLTHEQIEHFTMMNVTTLISHQIGGRLFRNFLDIDHRTDKSEVTILLECYELCDKILQNRSLIEDTNWIDNLLNLCPFFTWEKRINDVIGDINGMSEVLEALKQECVRNIENHIDYDRFRRELLRKAGKH